MIDAVTLEAFDRLQRQYIRSLARKEMQAWAGCFADPASYICIVRENEEQGLAVALMLDDSLARIRDRVKFVTEVWQGTFEDYTARHFVQTLACDSGADGALIVESSVLVSYTTTRGRSEVLVTGTYLDEAIKTQGGLKFRSKKVVLDTTTPPRYLVYPI